MCYEVKAGTLFIERIILGQYLYYNPELLITRIQNVLEPGRIPNTRQKTKLLFYELRSQQISYTQRIFCTWWFKPNKTGACVRTCAYMWMRGTVFELHYSVSISSGTLSEYIVTSVGTVEEYSLGILSPLSVLVTTSYERKVLQTPSKTGVREEWVH